jgi:hypothetical protein
MAPGSNHPGADAVGNEALTATLTRLRPERLRAELADGEKTEVAVPNVRKRWSRVCETLASLAWTRLECLDKKGAVLGVIESEEPVGVEEELAKVSGREQGLLALMLRSQDVALSRHERSLKVLLDGYGQLLSSVIGRVTQLESSYGQVLRLAQDAVVERAKQVNGDDSTEAMLKFLEVVGKPKAATPNGTNGVTKPAPAGGES